MRSLILLFALSAIATGCTKTVSKKVARYEVGQPAVVERAPRTGKYEVKWGDEDGHKLKTPSPIVCLIEKGEPVGFETDEVGTVYAIAGEQKIRAFHVPRSAKFALWHHHETRTTQFGKECQKFWTTAGEIAVGVGVGTAVVGLVAWDIYASTHEDACDDSNYAYSHPHRR